MNAGTKLIVKPLLILSMFVLALSLNPRSARAEEDEFEKLKKSAAAIKEKITTQIQIINDNLQFIEMFDHGRLIFLRESSQAILDTIMAKTILGVPESEFISTLRKYQNAEKSLLGLAPRVAVEPFKKLFQLAKDWAEIKGISDKIQEPKHTYDTLLAAEQNLTTIHDTVRSVALSSTNEEKAKMEKLEAKMVDLIARLSKAKVEAEVQGDTNPVVNDIAIPLILEIRKIGEEMISISPLQQGEVGTALFVMLGTVENFVDAKKLERGLQEYEKKMRASGK